MIVAPQARAGFQYDNVCVLTNYGPVGNPVLIGKTLYGIAEQFIGYAYVYKVNTDGSGFQIMHVFNYLAEGYSPPAGLVTVDNQWLYGMTTEGGPYANFSNGNQNPGYGSIFAININDTWTGQDTLGDFYVLYNFGTTRGDGITPRGRLLVTGSSPNYTLYGTTLYGGEGAGNIFSLQIVMNYDSLTKSSVPIYTPGSFTYAFFPYYSSGDNVTGAHPVSDLVEANLGSSGDWLFGTTSQGGANGYGTVYGIPVADVNLGGSAGITPLFPFTQSTGGPTPYSDLLLSGNELYGTTPNDVFCVPATGGSPMWTTPISSSYGSPAGDLCFEVPRLSLAGSTPGIIMGTIPGNFSGGNFTSLGYVFEVQSDGGTFTGGAYVNYSPLPTWNTIVNNQFLGFVGANPIGLFQGASGLFLDSSPATGPNSGIYGVGNSYDFYGSTIDAQTPGFASPQGGTLFKLHLVTGATILPLPYHGIGQPSGAVINWTDPPNIALQSAPALTGPWTNVIGATPPYTNFAHSAAQFFRLMISATNLSVLVPVPTTLAPVVIGATNATLSGHVSPNGADTRAWFEYGSTSNYSSLTPATLVSFTNGMVVTNTITTLTSGATYHCALVASNSAGKAVGGDVVFAVSPTVSTLPAIGVGPTNATLNGVVSVNGFNCTNYFEYGTSTNYGEQTVSVIVSATNEAPVAVTNLTSGLSSDTAYHFRLVATSSVGTITSQDMTVETLTPSGTIYVGNNLSDPAITGGKPDGGGPLVILGEYSPVGPLPTATVQTTLPSGTVQDVKFYGRNYNFTLCELAYNKPGVTNEQIFQVLAQESFTNQSVASPGLQTLTVSNFPAYYGALLAYFGKGPYYPQTNNDAVNSDATYESSTNPGSSTATPTGGTFWQFAIGANGDTNATYQYISNVFTNQGRTYGIGVDVLPGTP
ncbi:MAG TPA: hypothetical protein VNV43_15055 [Candidatus Acidoferrales bacterium]|nr:hypothetical protein [Candidatus Acidoferrales bacterium]